MDILSKILSDLNNSISFVSDDKILGPTIAILLILFAVFMAPKLPLHATNFVNNIYFKIIFIIIIVLLSKEHLALSLICLIIFFTIISNSHKKYYHNQDMQSSSYEIEKLSDLTPDSVHALIQPPQQDPATIGSFPSQPSLCSGSAITNIPIAYAHAYALDDNVRSMTLNACAVALDPNITLRTINTINLVNSTTDIVVSKIKENFTEYINNTIANESILRNHAKITTDPIQLGILTNSADKLLVAANAASSISNNNDNINNNILNSLIKSELLNCAADKSSTDGDTISTQQLQHLSTSISNVTNALIQADILKKLAIDDQKNGSAKLLKIADNHLTASLNMIDYNNNIEESYNAFFQNNYELANQYQRDANHILQKNITLNDNIDGTSVEYSDILYENTSGVPRFNVPTESKCDDIKAVNIQGWDDYANV